MDIKDIKYKKRLLEEHIATLVREFEALTGCRVDDIRIDSTELHCTKELELESKRVIRTRIVVKI